MADKIRIGLVGANVERGSWGARAHVPALQSLADYEIKAIATAHQETAEQAARAFGADLAFGDYNEMMRSPEVDLVAVCVRVPYHYEITMAALQNGKHAFCEWPLGANTAEAQEMASLARSKGVVSLVGLQGRSDSTLAHVRNLIKDGYIGDMQSVSMTQINGGGLGRTLDRTWQGDPAKGANTLTISAGHAIDSMCFAVGEFAEVSATLSTQIKQWLTTDTNELIETRSPDNIGIIGRLQNGAQVMVQAAAVPYNGSGFRLEVYGREGTLHVSGGSGQMGGLRLLGSRGNDALADIQVPDNLIVAPEGTPKGAPINIAQGYVHLADAIQGRGEVHPNFDDAVMRHRFIDAVVQSATEGRTVRL